MPVNETWRDFLLKHYSYLRRYENGVIAQMITPYLQARNEIFSKLIKLEETATGYTADFRIQRLRQQLMDVEGFLNAASLDASKKLERELSDLTLSERETYYEMLAKQYGPINLDISSIPYREVDQILREPLIYQNRGIGIRDSMLWNSKEAVDRIRTDLTQSIIQGEDMARAARRLVGGGQLLSGEVGNLLVNRAKIIARSEIMNVSNEVSRRTFRRNKDVLKGVIYVATLDRRTCLVCAGADGGVFYYGDSDDYGGPRLPRHPFCRCLYSPISYSWQELADRTGVRLSEKEKKNFIGAEPKSIKYEDWIKGLSKKEQIDILGKQRYDLWSSGKIKIKDMAKDGKILTLEQLRQIAEKNIGKQFYRTKATTKAITKATTKATTKTKTTDFIPSKTLSDAKKVINNLGFKNVTNPDGMSNTEFLKIHNETNKELSRIFSKYKNIDGIIKKGKRPITMEIIGGSDLGLGNGAVGLFDWDAKMMQLAGRLSSNPMLKLGKGVFNVGDDYQTILRHEFGHYFHHCLVSGRTSKDVKSFFIMYNKNPSFFAKNVSEYASENAAEAFAETFAAYTSPLYKSGSLPKEIETIFSKILGD